MFLPKSLFALLLCSVAAVTNASVTGFGIWHIHDAVQTGPSTLSNETAWLSAWVNTNTSNQVTAVSLSTPSGKSYSLTPNGTEQVAFGSDAATWSEFATEFPAGGYTFKVQSGPLQGLSSTVQASSPLVYPVQPMLSSASYNALQNLIPTTAINLSWGSWQPATGTTGYTFFTINDLTDPSTVASCEGSTTTCTGIAIPAGTFKKGHKYWYSIKFDSYDQVWLDGLGGCYGSSDMASETTGTFTVESATVSVSTSTLVGGLSGVGTVTLSLPTEVSLVINLSSTNSAASVPATVTVPVGAKSATFSISTAAVAAVKSGNIVATFNNTASTAALSVRPIGVKSVALSPTSVQGGKTASCTVTLEEAASPGSIVVSFTSSNTSVLPNPSSLTFKAGQQSVTFQVSTTAVKSSVTVSLTAVANSISQTAKLVVTH